MIGYSTLVASIFPSIKASTDFQKLVEHYPDALKSLFGIGQGGSITSGSGFIDAELFSLMLPLFVLVLAIGSVARTFAGEEEAGRLELILAYPLRRRDALRGKAVAVGGEIVVVCAVAFAALAVLDELIGLDLDLSRLAAALAGVAALGLLYGWLALAVGAAVPSKVLATSLPAGYAAAAYLVGGLHDVAGWLDPLRFLSPFWLVGSAPLQNGVRAWGVVVVVAAAFFTLAAGSVLVDRRDLESP